MKGGLRPPSASGARGASPLLRGSLRALASLGARPAGRNSAPPLLRGSPSLD